tara:strand:+ start:532 stop:942 length:411 start_codon:yes stop_codon:yes gene_type:complete
MAQPYEAVRYVLKNTSAITSRVPASRTWHGLKPKTPTFPNITFYEVSGPLRNNGIEVTDFTINCRAKTLSAALDLSRAVVDTFHGSAGTGISGNMDSFEFGRSSQSAAPGIIFEPEKAIYNAPVTVTIVYPVTTVS